jgi:hypothetical protein
LGKKGKGVYGVMHVMLLNIRKGASCLVRIIPKLENVVLITLKYFECTTKCNTTYQTPENFEFLKKKKSGKLKLAHVRLW